VEGITVSVPGWLSVDFSPNEAEKRAAWSLFVDLATTIASQPFDLHRGSLRDAFSSLYRLIENTRLVLRDAGPVVAASGARFGGIAIMFVTEVVAPFLLRWHEPLRQFEREIEEGVNSFEHERRWPEFQVCVDELAELQQLVQVYMEALAVICEFRTK